MLALAAISAAGPLSAPFRHVLVLSYGTGSTTICAVLGSRNTAGNPPKPGGVFAGMGRHHNEGKVRRIKVSKSKWNAPHQAVWTLGIWTFGLLLETFGLFYSRYVYPASPPSYALVSA